MPDRLNIQAQARRVAREFSSGDVIAVGPGLPCEVAPELPGNSPVQLLSDCSVLGYRTAGAGESADREAYALDSNGRPAVVQPGGVFLSTVEMAAMVRAGLVAAAVVQPGQVDASGRFSHWTAAAVPDLGATVQGSDLANGSRRLIGMMAHTGAGSGPAIVESGAVQGSGPRPLDLLVTDAAVIRPTPDGLLVEELAPGWRMDDLAAVTGARLSYSPTLREMDLELPSWAPVSKTYASGLEAVSDIPNGSVVNIDGFAGPGGMPHYLMVALRDQGATGLTIISNTAGLARVISFGTPPGKRAIDHSILIDNHQVSKAIASYPVSPSASRPTSFEMAFQQGEVGLEVAPQGTLAERIRAGGAGVAAFFTPTAAGTLLAEGKETREIDGRQYVLEEGLRADYCLIRGHKADTLGNVVYKGTSRNFNPIMATSARVTVVEVDEIVEPGQLGPEAIVTPGVYIDRVVLRPPDFSPYD